MNNTEAYLYSLIKNVESNNAVGIKRRTSSRNYICVKTERTSSMGRSCRVKFNA